MKVCFMDTESVGLLGPACLIQYQFYDTKTDISSDIVLHEPWKSTAGENAELIEEIINSKVVGFNLPHDIHHLAITYNMSRIFTKSEQFNIYEYQEFLKLKEMTDYCLFPKETLDLMVYGQQNEFQAIMKQKPIKLKRVPKVLAQDLVKELTKRVQLNPLYFAGMKGGYHWEINDIWSLRHPDEKMRGRQVTPEDRKKDNIRIDNDFVNLTLPFNPKKGLKDIVQHILGVDEAEKFDLSGLKKPRTRFWNPKEGDDWIDVFDEWKDMWEHDPFQREYARNDVVYTRKLYEYFKCPDGDSNTDVIAAMLGNSYQYGFDIDLEKTGKLFAEKLDIVDLSKEYVNVNAHRQVTKWLAEGQPEFIKEEIISAGSAKAVLEAYSQPANLGDDEEDESADLLRTKAQSILGWRHAEQWVRLLEKLLIAKKMYVQFKPSGTKSNRLSGGSMEGKGESINPQGIPSQDEFRECITFTNDARMALSGGDAKSFEVVIMCKVYDDPTLNKEMAEGLKFHALFGSLIYECTYEEMLSKAWKDKYNRAKTIVFRKAYGGQDPAEFARIAGVSVEQYLRAEVVFEQKYPKVRESREAIQEDYRALKQLDEGGKVTWDEPKEYVDSFKGFKRYYTAEIEVMRALFDLAQKLPQDMVDKGKHIKVMRRDKIQSASGATMSSLFGAAFAVQGQIERSASNHKIQSAGAEIIKELQADMIRKFQPRGIHSFMCVPFNIHDELQVVHDRTLTQEIEDYVRDFVKEEEKELPMFDMGWTKEGANWSETH